MAPVGLARDAPAPARPQCAARALAGEVAFCLEDVALELGGRTVLEGLSLPIEVGERLAVIGPSGAGKTSLIRLLSAALAPTRGRVLALARDTRALGARELRRLRADIGVLHQSDNLVRELRVVHNVLMGRLGSWSALRALVSLLAPREVDAARAALAEVELEAKLWDLPDQLSGGEQQRVGIARILLQDPRAVLADEPASGLDPRLGREVVRKLSDLALDRRRTLVVSLHALELLPGHFDQVLALRGGREFWRGPLRELSRDLLRELYGAEYRALHLDEIAL
jgi:phosphonate transport system ATP-binding protein